VRLAYRHGLRASELVDLHWDQVDFNRARMLERVAGAARVEIKVHPHMLRHACGFKLANDGVDTRALQAYLGHRNIQHTVRYTELAPTRFKGFWRD
jgi:site-specific recombinase XerD